MVESEMEESKSQGAPVPRLFILKTEEGPTFVNPVLGS